MRMKLCEVFNIDWFLVKMNTFHLVTKIATLVLYFPTLPLYIPTKYDIRDYLYHIQILMKEKWKPYKKFILSDERFS